jgi:hypothetical protein
MNVKVDPLTKDFRRQREKAKQRGIKWQLEYWEWLQIWQDSGRLNDRGCRSGCWVMGRNGDVGPYATGNVKIIRVETNNIDAAHKRNEAKRKAKVNE